MGIKKTKTKKKTIKKGLVSKRSRSVEGDIHFVHPTHVIKKSKQNEYFNKKGNSNYRPVAIVKENSDSSVEIAQIYGSPNKKFRSELSTTKMQKKSWIDINQMERSEKTGKKFMKNKSPLKKRYGKVTKTDLEARNKKKVTIK